jgi:hypothetical protein
MAFWDCKLFSCILWYFVRYFDISWYIVSLDSKYFKIFQDSVCIPLPEIGYNLAILSRWYIRFATLVHVGMFFFTWHWRHHPQNGQHGLWRRMNTQPSIVAILFHRGPCYPHKVAPDFQAVIRRKPFFEGWSNTSVWDDNIKERWPDFPDLIFRDSLQCITEIDFPYPHLSVNFNDSANNGFEIPPMVDPSMVWFQP